MKFSTKAVYGLRAVLCLADVHGQRAMSAAQLARQEGISVAYLEQILHLLKRKKWVKSVRGPAGGYVLAKKPSVLRLGPLLRDLDAKSFAFTGTLGVSSSRVSTAAAALFWTGFLNHLKRFLDERTLQDLLDEAARRKGRDPHLDFNI